MREFYYIEFYSFRFGVELQLQQRHRMTHSLSDD